VPGEPRHPFVERRVSGEVDPGAARALDEVPNGGGPRRRRPAPVARGNGRDRPAGSDAHRLADVDLARPQPRPADGAAEAARHDDEGIAGEGLQRAAIEVALRDTGGNRRKAAEMLQIGERTLYRKLREYQLPVGELVLDESSAEPYNG